MKDHECERKHGKIWEVRVNHQGEIFCISCCRQLQEEQVEPRVVMELRRKGY